MMMTLGPGFTLIVVAPFGAFVTGGSADASTKTSEGLLTMILEWPVKVTERKSAFLRGATYLIRIPITPAGEDVVPVSVVPARTGVGRAAMAAPLLAALVSTTGVAMPTADSPAMDRRAIERRRLPLSREATSAAADELRSSLARSDTSTSQVGYLLAAAARFISSYTAGTADSAGQQTGRRTSNPRADRVRVQCECKGA